MAETNELLLESFSLAFAGILFLIHTLRTKRAIPKIIQIFRRHNAFGISNAKSADELDLTSPDLAQEITRSQEYKFHALRLLKQAGIVRATEDGKLYIVQEKFSEKSTCNPNK